MSQHHQTPEWSKAVRVNRPRIEATLPAPCVDCGRPIQRGDRWQVGHIVSAAEAKAQGWTMAQINAPSNLGPTHTKAPGQRACNQIAGGKIGAAISNEKARTSSRMPSW